MTNSDGVILSRHRTPEVIDSTSLPALGALLDRLRVLLEAAAATAILVCTAPLLLPIMALVKATSRGPMIYSQVRVGLNGRPFRIYKVRTMTHDCERHSGPRWSSGKDSRVTPVGRILRLSHLDELPQLWNVIRGEMGLVGPRPERPEFVALLEKTIPRYRERLSVRPGITGLAQVQLPPDTDVASVRRKLACDLMYIARASLWLDLRILVATLGTLFHVRSTLICRSLRLPSGREPVVATQVETMDLTGARFVIP